MEQIDDATKNEKRNERLKKKETGSEVVNRNKNYYSCRSNRKFDIKI